MLIRTSVIVASIASSASAGLKITEIMYDPAGSNEFEYVELYNAGPVDIDLTGWVFARDLNQNPTNGANIPSGMVAAGGTAVLIRADGASGSSGRNLDGFRVAWENPGNPSINFVPIARWPGLVNTTSGTGLGLWSSVADYAADHAATFANTPPIFSYAEAQYRLTYATSGAWPAPNDSASIYLTDVALDEALGANWARSVSGVDGAYNGSAGQIVVGSSTVNVNRSNDVGSPGVTPVIPEPSTLGLIAVTAIVASRRR